VVTLLLFVGPGMLASPSDSESAALLLLPSPAEGEEEEEEEVELRGGESTVEAVLEEGSCRLDATLIAMSSSVSLSSSSISIRSGEAVSRSAVAFAVRGLAETCSGPFSLFPAMSNDTTGDEEVEEEMDAGTNGSCG
jgi:hypothetical protein